MRILNLAVWSVGALFLTAAAASADVQLSINDGRVSLVAKDATVRQILAEWSRVGQTRIVNAERVPGGPVTLELHDVPEAQALDTILRSVSGFMAAPRSIPVANASRFDRIIVMPTSAPPPSTQTRTAGPVFPQPAFPQPGIVQPGAPIGVYPGGQGGPPPAAADDDTDDEHPSPPVGRGPVFNAFPPQVPGAQPPNQYPGAVAPAQGPLNLPNSGPGGQAATPVGGSATPGMIIQQPQQQQPGQPVIPGQPRRPGGGGEDPRN